MRLVLMLRLTLAIATSYLLWAHGRELLVRGATPWLLLAAFLSNLVIYWLPAKTVVSPRFAALLVVGDTLWVTVVLLLSGKLTVDFFVIYFFVLFLAAITENLLLLTLGTALVSSAYLYLVYAFQGQTAFSSEALIRVPFFFAVAALYGFFTDRVRRERQRSAMALLTASTDALTQLPNRRGLEQLMDDAVARSLRTGRQIALLLIDLDHFKYINDSYGHLVGDETLLAIANRLREQVRRIDGFGRMAEEHEAAPTGRLGGDEFGLVVTETAGVDQVVQVAQRVCDIAAQPIALDELEVRTTVSIGIATFPGGDESGAGPTLHQDPAGVRRRLLAEADRALYHAKSSGRNTFCFHDPEMDREANLRIRLATELRRALERDLFDVVYQPQVDLDTLAVNGVEALLRWRQDVAGEPIGPAQFIPVAESTGQIRAIGEWVLTSACKAAAKWRQRAGSGLRVAVNMSAIQFRDPQLLESVERILAESELPGELLELELTESVLLRSTPKVRDTMLRIHEDLGVTLSLDDVGRGFSSLEYLCKMPFDKLKVDQFFIRSLGTDDGSRAIVSAIITLGLKLGLNVVAEGVETRGQLDLLRAEGCPIGQGYLFSPPVSQDDLTRFFDHHGRVLEEARWQRLSG